VIGYQLCEFNTNKFMATTMNEPLLVDVKEAGRLLGGIGQTKVYDLLKKRELPCVKIGRSTRIELAAIHAFIDRQRIGSKPRVIR
jgi:excisionase family DNA binding protein